MIVYLGLIFAFLLIEFLLINLELKLGYEEFKTGNITIILCVAMSLVELSSINENFEVITGKNYISAFVDFVINKLKNFIDKFIRKDDNND
jgi:cbb3-type cytochrome oxidase subunit 1